MLGPPTGVFAFISPARGLPSDGPQSYGTDHEIDLHNPGGFAVKKRALVVVPLTAVAMSLFGIPAANAEGFARVLNCGSNFRCQVNTNTSASVNHSVNGVQTGTWSTGGFHSSSRQPVGGSVTASAGTPGVFYSATASCACPPGVTCGSE